MFVYAWMVPSWAEQLLPQPLMEQFDTLLIQCRHIEQMHEGVWFRNDNFCTKWQLWELTQFLHNFSLIRHSYMHRWGLHGPINSYHSFWWNKFDTFPIQFRHIEHMHEGVWFRKKNLTRWQLWELRQLFPYMAFVYAWIEPSWADQLLPQQFDGAIWYFADTM